MKIQKKFFYNQLQTNVEIDDEMVEQVKDYFQVHQYSSIASFNISELNNNDHIRDAVLLVASYRIRQTKMKADYLQIEFTNCHGGVTGKVFDKKGSVRRAYDLLQSHVLFKVDGFVNEFQGMKSINIERLTPHKEPANAIMFLPSTKLDVQEMLFEMFVYLSELEEPHRSIALKVLQVYWKEFSLKPAAKSKHHAYLHGLLKHTLGLMRLTRTIKEAPSPVEGIFGLINIAQQAHQDFLLKHIDSESGASYRSLTYADAFDHLYEMVHLLIELGPHLIDWDLIIACELLHDIGKIFEYTHYGEAANKFDWLFPGLHSDGSMSQLKGGFDYDAIGKYLGHMTPGTLLLTSVVFKYKIPVSREVMVKYQHCILSHHGKAEWGSCIKPALPEAVILHMCDFLDSRWEMDDEVS